MDPAIHSRARGDFPERSQIECSGIGTTWGHRASEFSGCSRAAKKVAQTLAERFSVTQAIYLVKVSGISRHWAPLREQAAKRRSITKPSSARLHCGSFQFVRCTSAHRASRLRRPLLLVSGCAGRSRFATNRESLAGTANWNLIVFFFVCGEGAHADEIVLAKSSADQKNVQWHRRYAAGLQIALRKKSIVHFRDFGQLVTSLPWQCLAAAYRHRNLFARLQLGAERGFRCATGSTVSHRSPSARRGQSSPKNFGLCA